MQVEDHAGYRDTDHFTRWLPEYDDLSYDKKVVLCKTAITHWENQRTFAQKKTNRVKTDIAKRRWHDRWDWANGNRNRWENTLTDCMIDEGVLKRERIPF